MPYIHGHLRQGEWVAPSYRLSRRAVAGWAAAAAAAPLILDAGAVLRHVGPTANPGTTTSTSTSSGKPAASSGQLSLYAEPAAGMAPVYALTSGAHRTIRLTMSELVDQQAEQALVAATPSDEVVRDGRRPASWPALTPRTCAISAAENP